MLARRLLILVRNQLIPCSFVLKDFAGVFFWIPVFFAQCRETSLAQRLGELLPCRFRRSIKRNCGGTEKEILFRTIWDKPGTEPFDKEAFSEKRQLRSGRNPSGFAKAMVYIYCILQE